ncbi:unnamed protein product [Pedinophyceae sp. YPF-701]|nr:unnamed protein product [Pedinophyceae sp. YPF-701]
MPLRSMPLDDLSSDDSGAESYRSTGLIGADLSFNRKRPAATPPKAFVPRLNLQKIHDQRAAKGRSKHSTASKHERTSSAASKSTAPKEPRGPAFKASLPAAALPPAPAPAPPSVEPRSSSAATKAVASPERTRDSKRADAAESAPPRAPAQQVDAANLPVFAPASNARPPAEPAAQRDAGRAGVPAAAAPPPPRGGASPPRATPLRVTAMPSSSDAAASRSAAQPGSLTATSADSAPARATLPSLTQMLAAPATPPPPAAQQQPALATPEHRPASKSPATSPQAVGGAQGASPDTVASSTSPGATKAASSAASPALAHPTTSAPLATDGAPRPTAALPRPRLIAGSPERVPRNWVRPSLTRSASAGVERPFAGAQDAPATADGPTPLRRRSGPSLERLWENDGLARKNFLSHEALEAHFGANSMQRNQMSQLPHIPRLPPRQQVSEMSVQVAVRLRPLIAQELRKDSAVGVHANMQEANNFVLAGEGQGKMYRFDKVYGPASTQQELYFGSVAPLLSEYVKGFNVTVIAYGQTGSGKTYTMGTGLAAEDRSLAAVSAGEDSAVGILPRALSAIFAELHTKQAEGERAGKPVYHRLTCQFLEIYNEEIRDLLVADGPSRGGAAGAALSIKEDGDGAIVVAGASEVEAANLEAAVRIFVHGVANRATSATSVNDTSSRSHAIFTLALERIDPVINSRTVSKLHLVDLAGSERQKVAQTHGRRLKEGISINQGLLALGNVISALSDESHVGPADARRHQHVPYRASKLTRLLQDSLGGNSRTLVLACVSTSMLALSETVNTLKYATRAKQIKNRAVKGDFLLNGKPEHFMASMRHLQQYLDHADDIGPGAVPDLSGFGHDVLWGMLLKLRKLADRAKSKAVLQHEREQELLDEIAVHKAEVAKEKGKRLQAVRMSQRTRAQALTMDRGAALRYTAGHTGQSPAAKDPAADRKDPRGRGRPSDPAQLVDQVLQLQQDGKLPPEVWNRLSQAVATTPSNTPPAMQLPPHLRTTPGTASSAASPQRQRQRPATAPQNGPAENGRAGPAGGSYSRGTTPPTAPARRRADDDLADMDVQLRREEEELRRLQGGAGHAALAQRRIDRELEEAEAELVQLNTQLGRPLGGLEGRDEGAGASVATPEQTAPQAAGAVQDATPPARPSAVKSSSREQTGTPASVAHASPATPATERAKTSKKGGYASMFSRLFSRRTPRTAPPKLAKQAADEPPARVKRQASAKMPSRAEAPTTTPESVAPIPIEVGTASPPPNLRTSMMSSPASQSPPPPSPETAHLRSQPSGARGQALAALRRSQLTRTSTSKAAGWEDGDRSQSEARSQVDPRSKSLTSKQALANLRRSQLERARSHVSATGASRASRDGAPGRPGDELDDATSQPTQPPPAFSASPPDAWRPERSPSATRPPLASVQSRASSQQPREEPKRRAQSVQPQPGGQEALAEHGRPNSSRIRQIRDDRTRQREALAMRMESMEVHFLGLVDGKEGTRMSRTSMQERPQSSATPDQRASIAGNSSRVSLSSTPARDSSRAGANDNSPVETPRLGTAPSAAADDDAAPEARSVFRLADPGRLVQTFPAADVPPRLPSAGLTEKDVASLGAINRASSRGHESLGLTVALASHNIAFSDSEPDGSSSAGSAGDVPQARDARPAPARRPSVPRGLLSPPPPPPREQHVHASRDLESVAPPMQDRPRTAPAAKKPRAPAKQQRDSSASQRNPPSYAGLAAASGHSKPATSTSRGRARAPGPGKTAQAPRTSQRGSASGQAQKARQPPPRLQATPRAEASAGTSSAAAVLPVRRTSSQYSPGAYADTQRKSGSAASPRPPSRTSARAPSPQVASAAVANSNSGRAARARGPDINAHVHDLHLSLSDLLGSGDAC